MTINLNNKENYMNNEDIENYYNKEEINNLLSSLSNPPEVIWENADCTSTFATQDIIINNIQKQYTWFLLESLSVKQGYTSNYYNTKDQTILVPLLINTSQVILNQDDRSNAYYLSWFSRQVYLAKLTENMLYLFFKDCYEIEYNYGMNTSTFGPFGGSERINNNLLIPRRLYGIK